MPRFLRSQKDNIFRAVLKRLKTLTNLFRWHIIEEKKGGIAMKIAATYENGNIFPHFGKTEQFKVYETEGGKVFLRLPGGARGLGKRRRFSWKVTGSAA